MMTCNQIGFSVLLAILFCGSPQQVSAQKIQVESALVRLIEDIEIPARTAGVLEALDVREGQMVLEKAVLARLDAAEAQLTRDQAALELETALKQERYDVKLRLVKKAVLQAKLDVARAEFDLAIAQKQAKNDVQVRFAKKSSEVAGAELERALRSRTSVSDSVSQSEIDSLQLSLERTVLEVEQSQLDREIADITRAVKETELKSLKLAAEQAALELEGAEHEHDLTIDSRKTKQNGFELAMLKLRDRQIEAPIGGVIVKIFRRRGEWVEPGEKVMRIVRMDRLRVEGFVNAQQIRGEMSGMPATLTVELHEKPQAQFTGKVVFVSPEIDPVNNQVRVWAEFDNPDLLLRPGMRVSMTIDPAEADGKNNK